MFELPPRPSAAIAGTADRFPVRRIFCVGRNYAEHSREMGGDDRDPPFFFTKFADALVPGGGTIPYPPGTSNFHYEAELVVAIGSEGAAVTPERALDLVFGYAAGLDMTRRDLQFALREKSQPWDVSKNFAFSAPIGALRPVQAGHANAGRIALTVNGAVKQQADLRDMTWSTPEIIAHLSALERLLPGDLIYTGTPAGVGPVVPGDRIEVTIEGLEPLAVEIGGKESGFGG